MSLLIGGAKDLGSPDMSIKWDEIIPRYRGRIGVISGEQYIK